MAATVTLLVDGNDVWGGRTKVQHAKIALDNSYPTGGYSIPASKFGFKTIWNMMLGACGGSASAGYDFWYDVVNSKLMVFITAGFTPAGTNSAPAFTGTAHSHPLNLKNAAVADGATTRVNAGTNLLGANTGGDLVVAGNGANGGVQNTTAAGTVAAPVFTGTAVAAGAATQVANAADLSAITNIRVTALGR